MDDRNNSFTASAVVNPVGHGMQLCLTAIQDCKDRGDTVDYRKWLDIGLRYANLQIDSGGCGLHSPSAINFGGLI